MANDIDKTSPHYKGEFGSIYEVNQKFPSGGVEGDYVAIDGWAHYWNADRGTWCVNAQRDSYWDELISGIIEKFKLFKGATYMGVANLDSVPAKAIGAKMYYFATVAGTYKNFGELVVPQGINVLYSENGSSWVCSTLLEVAQELGVSTRNVVSQKVVNEALAKKADKETVDVELGKKANTADVDTKFTEEKKRVDAELGKKFDKESVAQEAGDSEELVMSQKAVSDKLCDLSDNLKNCKISYGAFLGQGLENIAFEYINGTYIDKSGKQMMSDIYVSSKFIKVNAGEEYLCVTTGSASTAAVAGYSSDNENSFVEVIELNGESKPFLKKIKIPASVEYIRLSYNTTSLNISNFSIYKIRQNCLNNLELQEKLNKLQETCRKFSVVFESYDITTVPTTLNDKYGDTTRINVYLSFKYAKFINFEDYEKILKVYVYWNTYTSLFNIRLAYLNSNNEWVQSYSLRYNYEDINPTKQAIISIIYNVPNSNKRIELLVDTSFVQMPDAGIIFSSLTSSPEYIFAKTCFVNEEAKTEYKPYVPKTIRLYPNEKLPTISFEFDDISENDVDVHNLFVEKGLRCGFAFVASDAIIKRYSSTYLDWQREGFDILNHSIDGKEVITNNYDYNAALNAIATAKEKLEKAGFVINGWVSPSSVLSSEFLPIIKKFHAYGFTMKDSFENGRQSNPCQLIRYGMQGNTLEQIKSKIDEYISKDKILVLYGHSADFGTSYVGETWDINKIGKVLDYCLEKRNSGLCYLGNTDDCIKYYFKL